MKPLFRLFPSAPQVRRPSAGSLARYVVAALAAALFLGSSVGAQEGDPLAREREEQTGTAITILFDNSGSMNQENKIGQAKAAFRTWLQTVPASYKFALITFEGTGNLVVPLGEKTRDLVAQRVSKLVANTSTPICGSLKIAREQIEKRRREVTPYERHVVLIFTDGQETVDRRGINGVREEIAKLRRESIEVVGIGFHGEGDYMNGVATRFALAGDEQELRRGLAKVDAEFGGSDDLVVSKEDLAALKRFRAPGVQPIAQATEPTPSVSTSAAPAVTTTAPSAPAPTPTPSGPNYFFWVVAAIFVWSLRGVFKSAKTRKS